MLLLPPLYLLFVDATNSLIGLLELSLLLAIDNLLLLLLYLTLETLLVLFLQVLLYDPIYLCCIASGRHLVIVNLEMDSIS